MSTQTMKCPHHCGGEVGIDSGESDAVECACTECGGEFTAGEARRGQLYVRAEATERRIAALESAMNSLLPCPELPVTTLEAVGSAPQIRIRVAHSNTLKEGWRLSETTVEWTGSLDDFGNGAGDDLNDAMRVAFLNGTDEVERRKPGGVHEESL